jgi:Cu-Zn family superoxide dismutase
MRRALLGFSALCLLAATVQAETSKSASAVLQDAGGKQVGTVTLRQTPANGVWLNVKLDGLPAGMHGFHIHETGKCAGDFKSAGAHYAPAGHQHGVLVAGGAHAGDLPNIHVPDSGRLQLEVFVPSISLKQGAKNTLFDADGSAFVVHQGVDDYTSQPSGDAGARIACGVVADKTVDNAAAQ